MKLRIAATLIFSASISQAIAATDSTSQMAALSPPKIANIQKGNVQVGGSLGFSHYNSGGTSASSYYFDPQAEYFVMDRLSVGGSISFMGQSGNYSYTSYGLGPSLSYYFYESGPMAAYVAQAIEFNKISDQTETFVRGRSSLGIKYFIVPQVAFGIDLSTRYDLGSRSNMSSLTILGGNFSFFF
jgi:hypothetical protein